MLAVQVDPQRVPRENLRVGLEEFLAVWAAAEARLADAACGDWYSCGVAEVCRWLARWTVRPDEGPWFAAPAPVSGRLDRAMPELIEAEWQLAESLSARPEEAGMVIDRLDWIVGVIATFQWARGGCSVAPLTSSGAT